MASLCCPLRRRCTEFPPLHRWSPPIPGLIVLHTLAPLDGLHRLFGKPAGSSKGVFHRISGDGLIVVAAAKCKPDRRGPRLSRTASVLALRRTKCRAAIRGGEPE